MWYRLKNGKIVFVENGTEGPTDYMKANKKLLHILMLGDILYLYDKSWSEFYKSEIVCLNDVNDDELSESYDWGVNNYEGNDFYSLESLLYGLYEDIEVKGIVTREVFMANMSNLDTSLGD